MPDRTLQLTRRRVLGGLLTIGAGSAAAGAGTMAYFSDTESSTSNSVESGTLDLTIDGGNSTVTFFTETSIAPGDSGQATLPVGNAGSLTGYVDVSVADLRNYENAIVGNESSADSTGGDPGQGNGELQDNLEVNAYFLNGGGGNEVYLGANQYETIGTAFATGTDYDVSHQISGGGSDTFVIDWQLPSGTGREAQSDSVELDLTFELGQNTGQ